MNDRSGRDLPSTFETLVRPHLKSLFRVAFRFTGSREDAEDLIQELLAKLYPRREELLEIERLRPWLTRVMYRIFIDNKRRYARSPVHLAVSNGSDEDNPGPLEGVASEEATPEEHTEQAVTSRQLVTAVERLSEDHRNVLSLHDVEGYTLEEMQMILDCPIGTLKSRLHRARARLRELLADVRELP
jgi:RNA polymerase sigma-70 factor (ECF subfamily)